MLCKTFCSAPWIGLRINYEGDFVPCRFMWEYDANYQKTKKKYNINDVSMLEYWNSDEQRELRSLLTHGKQHNLCRNCYYDDDAGNFSGRQRNLNSAGIVLDNFENTLVSSPYYKRFLHSEHNNGHTDVTPTDLQIDLGSTCNGACVMCSPYASSKLIPDFKQLAPANPDVFYTPNIRRDWSRNQHTFNTFLNELGQFKNLRYIQLLGGETFYINRFYEICDTLVSTGQSKSVILGTTTNCTVYTEKLEQTLLKFDQVHLGLSIETFTPTNDYIRWPAKIADIRSNIMRFIELRNRYPEKIFLSLRFTPNMLSIMEVDSVFKFMFEHDVTAEKCKIMLDPSWISIPYLPPQLIDQAIERIQSVIDSYNLTPPKQIVTNLRNRELRNEVNTQTVYEILNYLKNLKTPNDVDSQLDKCVRYLRGFESLRKNSLYDYIPELATYLERYGYAKD